MDMIKKTVRLLAKKDISALHQLTGEMKKYIEHAKPIPQRLIRKLENDELGTSFQRIQGKMCLP